MYLSFIESVHALNETALPFIEFFKHGSLIIELFKPDKIDHQTPHLQDEVYVIAEGSGIFNLNGAVIRFQKNDVLFVPAGIQHRFESFSDDFCTWVIFYGPRGGESIIN